MFTLHGWDPSTRAVQDWLGQLQQNHPRREEVESPERAWSPYWMPAQSRSHSGSEALLTPAAARRGRTQSARDACAHRKIPSASRLWTVEAVSWRAR